MKYLLLLYTVLSAFFAATVATVYEAYPINKQLPSIARLDEDFKFTISNDTFKSSGQGSVQVHYEAYELPDWLSFDSGSLTFSGKVDKEFLGEDEVKYFDVVLQGTDSSDDSSYNATSTLVATSRSGISVAEDFNILSLLKNYGYTNGKDALKLSPRDIFNVTFGRDNFDDLDNSAMTFYGRSLLYHAPLPNWVFFDANNLKFSGEAPVVNSDIAPEMDYSFALIATDIEGYSAASIDFQIVVGAHRLTTSIENVIVINVTDSGSFSYPIPLDYIYLNDEPIKSDDLADIKLVGAPDWVSISDNNTIKGTLPSTDNNSTFQLSIYDRFMDVVYLNFLVESTQELFAISSFPKVNVTRGEWFQYSLLPSQFTSYENTKVKAVYESQDDWLQFQPSNVTFYGKVPKNFDSMTIKVIASDLNNEETLPLSLVGIDGKNQVHSSSSSSSASHSATSTSSSSSASSSNSSTATNSAVATFPTTQKKNNNIVAIVCGVVIPVVFILLLLLLFFLWRRRRNNDKSDDKEKVAISSPDPKNPANEPNGYGYENPFSDESTLSSNEVSAEAKRLATLNAMKLDDISNSSTLSSFDEKNSDDSVYMDAAMANSKDMLIHRDDESSVFDDKYRSSSVYFQNAPSQRKSWRFSRTKMPVDDRAARQSYASLNTVSTQELLSSELKTGSSLPHDPRKSSLGLRDSVFWNKDTSNSSPLKTVNENTNPFTPTTETMQSNSGHSSMSSDGLIPVKQENGQYKWAPNEQAVRKNSTKRLGSVVDESGVNYKNAARFMKGPSEKT